ncbi:MAG: RidA family protein [Microbacteriaceae bacterium]
MNFERTLISSGSAYEPVVGYSRAVKAGPFVFVAGTTAGAPEGAIGGSDPAEQTREIFRRVAVALESAGASFADVVRTRIYLTNIADFEAVGAVHGEIFGTIRPAATAVEVCALAAPDMLVEIDVDAIIGSAA